MMDNYMKLEFFSKSANEGFARVAVAAFAAGLDPTVEDLADIKTAVSEAVTNSIIHGYDRADGTVVLECAIRGRELTVTVTDQGSGIADVAKAREPMYTSKPELERSGMGFTVMESFMDSVSVESQPGAGTKVVMTKAL